MDGRHTEEGMRCNRGIMDASVSEECPQFARGVGAEDGEGHIVPGQPVACGDARCCPGGDEAREAAADVIHDETGAGEAIHLAQHMHSLSGREVMQRQRAEDDVERALGHWNRTSVADCEGDPRYADKRASRLG